MVKESAQYDNYLDKEGRIKDDYKATLDKFTEDQINDAIVKKYEIPLITKKNEFVFTIDSNVSNDHDDALSYNFKQHKVTIYITNVALTMDHLELWDSFTNRIYQET